MARLLSLRSLRKSISPLRGEKKRISVAGNAGQKSQGTSPSNSRESSTDSTTMPEVKDDSSFRERYSLTRKVLTYSLIIFLNEHPLVDGASPVAPEARAKNLCERYCTYLRLFRACNALSNALLWGVAFPANEEIAKACFKMYGSVPVGWEKFITANMVGHVSPVLTNEDQKLADLTASLGRFQNGLLDQMRRRNLDFEGASHDTALKAVSSGVVC